MDLEFEAYIMSILVVGTVAFDTLSSPFGKRSKVLGGSASYFSVGAKLFSPVNLVAVVGRDFPKEYLDFFKRKKIGLEGLEIQEGETFHWQGEYGCDVNIAKTIRTDLNVLASFNPKLSENYKRSKIVFLANVDPDIQQQVLAQVKSPKITALDTMNFWIEHKRDQLLKVLKKIDILFINDSEAKQLVGNNNLLFVGKSILKLGPKIVVIKKGEHGALLVMKDFFFSLPAFLIEKVVDPTGAGDTFASGFLGCLSTCKNLTKKDLKQALVMGTLLASFTVEDFSLCRLGAITKKDINRRYKEYRRMIQL